MGANCSEAEGSQDVMQIDIRKRTLGSVCNAELSRVVATIGERTTMVGSALQATIVGALVSE